MNQPTLYSEEQMAALASWEDCDQVLVGLLSEVITKAQQFLNDPLIAKATNEDTFVDEKGNILDPATLWLFEILALFLAQGDGHKAPEGTEVCELPIQKMFAALMAPSKRRFLAEVLPDFLQAVSVNLAAQERVDEEEDDDANGLGSPLGTDTDGLWPDTDGDEVPFSFN